MADYSPTKIQIKGTAPVVSKKVAGETLAYLDIVYKTAAGKYSKARADSTDALIDNAAGMVLTAAALDETFLLLEPPIELDVGETFTLNVDIVLSAANAGKMAPRSDLVSTDYLTLLGYPTTTSTFMFDVTHTNTQVP